MIKNTDRVLEDILWLKEQDNLSYESLMQMHLKLIRKARKEFKGNKEIELNIKEIVKNALKVSIRNISGDEPFYHTYFTINHPAIERASRFIYDKTNSKSSIQQLVEDAGETYYQKHKFRDLKGFIEDIRHYGTSLKELNHDLFYNKDQGLGRAIKNRFGSIGKAVILTGVDYSAIGNTMTKRSKYKFSRKELFEIIEDNSLEESMKTMTLFNALCLQNYDLKELNLTEEPFRVIDDNHLNNKEFISSPNSIRLRRFREIVKPRIEKYAVELAIHPKIENPFHKYTFWFYERFNGIDSLRLYREIDRTLFNLGLNENVYCSEL